jgi:osmotically-inducible protein OsmY
MKKDIPMQSIPDRLAAALPALALLLALGACDRTDNRVEMRKAVEASKAAGTAAAVEPKEAAAGTDKAVDAAGEVTARVAEQLRIDDALIAAKVTTGLAADRNLTALHIKVAAHAGVVTLRGPAPSAAARARAEEIARNVQGVTSVINQLDVQAG